MALHTRSGKGPTGLIIRFSFSTIALALTFASSSPAQTPLSCAITSTNLNVRVEGLTEPVGNIVLTCSGGTPGAQITTNITVTLPVPVTNRVSTAGVPNATLTVNGAASGTPTLLGSNAVAFNGVTVTVPAAGPVSIQISNLRGAMTQAAPGQLITANLSASTGLAVNNANPVVGTVQRGLLATYATKGITCVGSPLPATINLANLFAAGTIFTSTRLTEGFAGAFMPKDANSDTGTRIMVSYSGFPAGSQLYVPDVVAGSDTVQPTAGGDIGGQQSGGSYAPSAAGSLLLARVLGSDANGAGGAPVTTKAAIGGQVAFNGATQVQLVNGVGAVVYEVIDSNPSVLEFAQFPLFLGLAAAPNQTPVIAHDTVSFAPVSTVVTATTGDAIPRFTAIAPPSDCAALGDCGASYFPALAVDTTSLQYAAPAGGAFQTKYVRVNNTGGGFLLFSAALTFQSGGTGWLTVDPSSGINNATIRLDANPAKLAAGTYQATLTIDAGSAWMRTIPVTFTVGAPVVTISSITNAATFQPGPLVAGSLATIKGVNFATSNVAVTFDGVPGQVLYASPGQINVQVPASIVAKTQAQVVVTVNGNASAAQTVQLAATAPGIFGTLNQDYSLNAAGAPAAAGQVVQIFLTGLTSAVSGAVTVNIQGQNGLTPVYAGPAPGLTGVQQVNVVVPGGLAAGAEALSVCAVGSAGQPVCSPGAVLVVR
jgi:uncharacterized protein (TIGR03437 family)